MNILGEKTTAVTIKVKNTYIISRKITEIRYSILSYLHSGNENTGSTQAK